ncbi:MAG: peptidoglycan editing factor PgeF [Betaproteobacteria bacterium]
MRADGTLAARLLSSGLDWIVPDWPAPAPVCAFSTTRNGVGGTAIDFARDHPNAAAARALLRRFVPDEPLWLAQSHGTAVVSVDVGHFGTPEADGAVSHVPGHVCAVLSADCLPVLFADRRGSVVAAMHAGWRGLAAGALEASVGSMQAAPADLLAWLGPAIGPEAFEVGAEVHAAFCNRDPGAGACFVATREGKWHADLYALARRALVRAGIDDAAIHGGGRCTYSETTKFYSYRRGGPDRSARMATLIWLARD